MVESVQIKLRCADLDGFVALFATNISRGGIFLQSRSTHTVDDELYFCLRLADNSVALEGKGRVIWVRPYDDAQPDQPFGVGLRFTELDEENQNVVDSVLASKKEARKGRRKSRQRMSSPTQEVHALARRAVAIGVEPTASAELSTEGELDGTSELNDSPPASATTIVVEGQSPIALAQRILDEASASKDIDKQASETDLLAAVLATTGDVAAVDEMLEQLVAECGLNDERIAQVIANTVATPELVPKDLSELSSPALATNQELVDALTSLADSEASKVGPLPQAPTSVPEDVEAEPSEAIEELSSLINDAEAEERATSQWAPEHEPDSPDVEAPIDAPDAIDSDIDSDNDSDSDSDDDGDSAVALAAIPQPEEDMTEPLVSREEHAVEPPSAIPVPLATGLDEDSIGGPTLPGLPAPPNPPPPVLPVDVASPTEEVDLNELETIEDSGLLEIDETTDPGIDGIEGGNGPAAEGVTETTAIGSAPQFLEDGTPPDANSDHPIQALEQPLPAEIACAAPAPAAVEPEATDDKPLQKKKSGFFRRIFGGKEPDAEDEQ
jgi:uncharacterized protein (TIGR02266 family)